MLEGDPPTPAGIRERTLRWFPSARLPPVKDPYVFYWEFGRVPSYPGAVANAQGSGYGLPGDAHIGLLPVRWFPGPQSEAGFPDGHAFIDRYVNAAKNPLAMAIMVDEWQSVTDVPGATTLHVDNPYGITGSIQGMIEAKKADPGFFITVAWRGEDNIKPACDAHAVDLLMIEAYSHISAAYPTAWATGGNLGGTFSKIGLARSMGMGDRTIVWLGSFLAPHEYHPGHELTVENFEEQVKAIREFAPEGPGLGFYANSNPELADACDAIVSKYFVEPAPAVSFTYPLERDVLFQNHVRMRVDAVPNLEGGRFIREYQWFIDNRLVAKTSGPTYLWDTRGDNLGLHVLTAHAIDSHWNRAAAQITVLTTRR